MQYKIDQEILYKTTNSKGVEVWKKGIIFGIKKAEATSGPDIVLGYLVDTGKDDRVDEVTFDKRSVEITARATDLMHDGATQAEAFEQAEKSKKLPKSELVTEQVRQPQQVEVSPENIKPAK